MTPPVEPGLATRALGARVKRLEDPSLVTGAGAYLDDIRLPGLVHAAFARSPHAHAHLSNVETEEALRVPGVLAVITARDLAGRVAPLVPRLEREGFASTAWPAFAAPWRRGP